MIVMKGLFGAGVAFDPFCSAVGVMFFFPDGDRRFDGINDRTTGAEGGIAVSSGNNDTNGYFANLQVTSAVDAACRDNIMLTADFCKDTITLLLCEGGEGLVFKGGDLASLVMIAHPALKTGKTAGGRVPYLIIKCLRVNGLVS